MIATHNQQTSQEGLAINRPDESETIVNNIQTINTSTPILLPHGIASHNPTSGLNPIADAASYLFSVIGKLKQLKSYRQLSKLQSELMQEINTFHESIKNHGYNIEYIIVCRYILCATLDDIISNTVWGSMGQWDTYSLLAAFNQDPHHHDKFFTIMERALKEPALYIDLMELMYLCLSMGYRGQYRATEHSTYQIEQITNSLFKHIRAYRGSFSKVLSPTPLKTPKHTHKKTKTRSYSLIFTIIVTACIIMTIFVSLGYLMDVISNEAYTNISQFEKSVSHETTG